MPAFQTFLHALNQLTARDQIHKLNRDNWGPDAKISDRIRENLPEVKLDGIAEEFLLYREVGDFVDSLPPSIHDCLREIVRGQIENQNRAWRWWFPRGTRLDNLDQTHVDNVANLINGQRRRSLDYQSPTELYDALTVH